jgi:hypothetical protein
VKWICAAGKKQKSNKISGRQLGQGVNHTLTQLSAGEDFIEFCHHESFKTEKEQKLHAFLYIVQETE